MLARCLLGAIATVLAASAPLKEDAPVAGPPKAGAISGRLAPAETIKDLRAVSRVTGKEFLPARFDKTTGRFTFEGLPGDARYDLVVGLADGRQIEGIDLDFVEQRLLNLAEQRRKDLGLPPEPPHAFSTADAEEILKFVADLQDFMDIRRVLYVAGRGPRATVLVELMRAREFHASKRGEVIWRVELWYFQYYSGGWQCLANQERVLRRERLPADQWQKIDVEYYPELSVYISPEGASSPVEFTIPPKIDPSRGRPADSDVELKTAPHILGLDSSAPASQPS
ncbi:MAG: hypothetical protein ABSH10_06350 [Phycisphaerae bacterium]|jgi:hypothetical protein